MSLDVYLRLNFARVRDAEPAERIFVRRDGATVEVTRGEWDEMNPGRAPVVIADDTMERREVFTANITHNMGAMAAECGLYDPLWCPEENNLTRAAQLVEPLRAGLTSLRDDRARLQEFNPENGWGNYDLLVRFTENYLAACEQWPDAEVSVWK